MTTRVCWLGHACILIESDGQKVLIDPFLTGNPAAATKAEDVSANFILVSHGRGDGHCQLRDQSVAAKPRAEECPRPAARRRPRLSLRSGQADAGVPRLYAA